MQILFVALNYYKLLDNLLHEKTDKYIKILHLTLTGNIESGLQ